MILVTIKFLIERIICKQGIYPLSKKKNLFLVTYENYSIQSNEKIHGFLILLKSTTTTLHNWSHNKKPRLIIGVFD